MDAGDEAPKSSHDLVVDRERRDRLTLARTLGISERTLLGWTPAERHEHYDAADNLTGYTIVHREPEWNDAERAKMLDLAKYEVGVHETCGLHDSVAQTDPDMAVDAGKCPVCAGIEWNIRAHRAADDSEGADLAPAAPHPGDGRRFSLRPILTDDMQGG